MSCEFSDVLSSSICVRCDYKIETFVSTVNETYVGTYSYDASTLNYVLNIDIVSCHSKHLSLRDVDYFVVIVVVVVLLLFIVNENERQVKELNNSKSTRDRSVGGGVPLFTVIVFLSFCLNSLTLLNIEDPHFYIVHT